MITPITDEQYWRSRLENIPVWDPPSRATLVISPHPDDETLGAGGLIAQLRSKDIEVMVIAVTDGENAYEDTQDIGLLREQEQTAALSMLGVDAEHIVRLRMPDSGLVNCEDKLTELLLPFASNSIQIVAPWKGDFHPDHEVCGRAAEAVAREKNLPLISFFFWTWHRGTPKTIADLDLVALRLSESEMTSKWAALQCHRSQLEHAACEPILPPYLLGPVDRAFEVYLKS